MGRLETAYLLNLARNVIGQNKLEWRRFFEPIEKLPHHHCLFRTELWTTVEKLTARMNGETLGRIAQYAGNLPSAHDSEHFLGSKSFYFATTVNEVANCESMPFSGFIPPLQRLAMYTIVAAVYDVLFREMIRARQYTKMDGQELTKGDVDWLVYERAVGRRGSKFIDEFGYSRR